MRNYPNINRAPYTKKLTEKESIINLERDGADSKLLVDADMVNFEFNIR